MKKGIFITEKCKICDGSFRKYKRKMKFCSNKCFGESRKIVGTSKYKELIKEKILSSIALDEETKCWNWSKQLRKGSRPRCWFNGKFAVAARVSYEVFLGNFDENLLICHKCDNGLCVNPEHLFVGSYIDNKMDCVKKNRQACGEKIGISKLKSENIPEIRNLRSQGLSQQAIADRFNVGQTVISSILLKKTWRHV